MNNQSPIVRNIHNFTGDVFVFRSRKEKDKVPISSNLLPVGCYSSRLESFNIYNEMSFFPRIVYINLIPRDLLFYWGPISLPGIYGSVHRNTLYVSCKTLCVSSHLSLYFYLRFYPRYDGVRFPTDVGGLRPSLVLVLEEISKTSLTSG